MFVVIFFLRLSMFVGAPLGDAVLGNTLFG